MGTHTYATLEVSPAVFDEVKDKLTAAGYGHAMSDTGDGTVIDMHGIGLLRAKPTQGRGANTPLSVSISDGVLSICVGVDRLAHAIAGGDDFHSYDQKSGEYIRGFAITDAATFAKDVTVELEREAEDGSTPLSKLLDEVGQSAIDEGSTGVHYAQRIKFGEKSPEEKW